MIKVKNLIILVIGDDSKFSKVLRIKNNELKLVFSNV